MKALQRLQQHILGTNDDIFKGYYVTPKASRIRDTLKKHAYTVTGTSILASVIAAGPALDRNAGLTSKPDTVPATYLDLQRRLVVAEENAITLKKMLVEGPPLSEKSFVAVAQDMRKARTTANELKAELESYRKTHQLPTEDQVEANCQVISKKMKN